MNAEHSEECEGLKDVRTLINSIPIFEDQKANREHLKARALK